MSPFIRPTVTTVEWGGSTDTASVTHRNWGTPGRLGATALGRGEPGQASERGSDRIHLKAESTGRLHWGRWRGLWGAYSVWAQSCHPRCAELSPPGTAMASYGHRLAVRGGLAGMEPAG